MEIYLLTASEVDDLSYALRGAVTLGREVRLARHGSGIAFKVGGGMWSPPLGELEATIERRRAVERILQAEAETAAAQARALEGHTEGDV